ncbi:MAG: FAD-dependent oxidoreductase [Oscillospiraceae bacterium]|nr:FAD-dependent oxidoreductase [Oscillospiraceae bacterium]
MPVIVSQIITKVSASNDEITAAALKKLSLKPADAKVAGVHKTSLDARDNSSIKLVSSVWIELHDKLKEKRLAEKNPSCTYADINSDSLFPEKCGSEKLNGRVIIAGFGPAGMFAALTLAEYGFRPVVLERGGCVDERVNAVEGFWKGGAFSEETNVQFGEGGAGTFSDGKLTTRIKDPMCRRVLERFAEYGAPEEILTKAKPHIGTDKLRGIVKTVREKIIGLGGEVRFHAKLTDVKYENGTITSVTVNGSEKIPCGALILAIGHSARDTFEMLLRKDIFIEPKPFSVGARIEHKQTEVNRSLYGKQYDNPVLPQGEYQLSYRKGERGVYTFCMCPGGTVVPSQSENDTVVTNGMSEFARDGENANAALVVSVTPDDYGRNPLDGVTFARSLEKRAFELGGRNYKAPACTVGSFLDGGGSLKGADVSPTYARGVEECDFRRLFPVFVTDMMAVGLKSFAGKMKCFGDRNAVMTAPETRTSSPVRITRGEDLQSVSVKGLYPCGEGAGYAGGIMSAAVDGLRIAVKIIEKFDVD